MKRFVRLSVLIIALVLASCTPAGPEVTPEVGLTPTHGETRQPSLEPTPTATTVPPVSLTVCTTGLPSSLFPYDGKPSVTKENMTALILPEPYVAGGDGLVPVILEKIPSQSDGDLQLVPVAVQRGQPVVDAWGALVVLKPGVTIRPSGCRQMDCAVVWDGESPIEMDQMRVEFQLRDGLTWSDGTPVTSADSVFSFSLASDPMAPGLKWAEDRTDGYQVVDQQRVEWLGRPGFTTAQLEKFFWTPLPSFLLEGPTAWLESKDDTRLSTASLGYGPFVISNWGSDSVTLNQNPYYPQMDEEMPLLDEVVFRVIEGGPRAAWQALQDNRCDVLNSSFGFENDFELLTEIQNDANFNIFLEEDQAWTQLVFGIQPAVYDEFYNPLYGDRPDYFGDPRTRQAIGACLDRQALMEATMAGFGSLWQSFLPPGSSQLDAESQIGHETSLGIQMLEEVGWLDHDNDPQTPRQAWGINNVPAGTPLALELLISPLGFHQDLARLISEMLGNCGVGVDVTVLPEAEIYAPGPGGPLFGRAFYLTLLSWQPMPDMDCRLYQSWQVPNERNQWVGTNVAGFSDQTFDGLCADAALALPDESEQTAPAAELYFIQALPAVPLSSPGRVIITSANFCFREPFEENDLFFENLIWLVDKINCP